MEWVANATKISGRPSVATMSLSGGYTPSVDEAVAALVSSGVPTVVPAGNEGINATYYSPGSEPSATTVAASDIDDQIVWNSNKGSGVDIFAPGMRCLLAALKLT